MTARPLAAELARLDGEATKGPWRVVGLPWNDAHAWINAGSEDPHVGHPVCDFSIQADDETGDPETAENMDEDAALTVALRNAVPLIVAALELCEAMFDNEGSRKRWLDAVAEYRRVSASLGGDDGR